MIYIKIGTYLHAITDGERSKTVHLPVLFNHEHCYLSRTVGKNISLTYRWVNRLSRVKRIPSRCYTLHCVISDSCYLGGCDSIEIKIVFFGLSIICERHKSSNAFPISLFAILSEFEDQFELDQLRINYVVSTNKSAVRTIDRQPVVFVDKLPNAAYNLCSYTVTIHHHSRIFIKVRRATM